MKIYTTPKQISGYDPGDVIRTILIVVTAIALKLAHNKLVHLRGKSLIRLQRDDKDVTFI